MRSRSALSDGGPARLIRIVGLIDRPPIRRGLVLALWLAVAAAIGVRLWVMFASPILPGMPTSSAGYFLDLRDTIWTPGRFLLDGGNPYDPVTYLAVNPWALPFSLYAPAWLLLVAVLAPLPYLVCVAVYQVLAIGTAVLTLRLLVRWSMPTVADLALPAGMLWLNIWYPGRAALSVQITTTLALLGVLLVVRSITSPDSPRVDRAGAVGVALTLLKAQFGAFVVVVALAGGRWREVWRGAAGLAVLSAPGVVVCAVAAGGPIELFRSFVRDLAAWSSMFGLNVVGREPPRRLDLLGLLTRYGVMDPPAWLVAALLLLTLAVAVVVVRISRHPLHVSAVVCTSILIGIYHGTYDTLLLLVPVAVGTGMIVRGELRRFVDRATFALPLLVVLHLHTVSGKIIPGFDTRAADTLDVALIIAGMCFGLYAALTAPRGEPAATRDAVPAEVPAEVPAR